MASAAKGVLGVAGVAGSVFTLATVIKGAEKRYFWIECEAQVLARGDQGSLSYIYFAGDYYEHEQAEVPESAAQLREGDMLVVRVHPRNPELSVVDPPERFTPLVRDYVEHYAAYRGTLYNERKKREHAEKS